MLIQNTNSAAPVVSTPAPRLAGDGAPVPVAAQGTHSVPAELPQVAVKATGGQQATDNRAGGSAPTHDQMQNAVNGLNEAIRQQTDSNIEFTIDQETSKVVIKVVESGTGKVIQQIPSEEIMTIARMIDQVQKGLLVKQQA
jgi:flagellar protein FlaG